MKFRLHRGGYAKSMATVREIETLAQLKAVVREEYKIEQSKPIRIEFDYLNRDGRNGWLTYNVICTLGHMSPPERFIAGMSDGVLFDTSTPEGLLRHIYYHDRRFEKAEYLNKRTTEYVVEAMKQWGEIVKRKPLTVADASTCLKRNSLELADLSDIACILDNKQRTDGNSFEHQSEDEPEGFLYIKISHTLTTEMSKRLHELAHLNDYMMSVFDRIEKGLDYMDAETVVRSILEEAKEKIKSHYSNGK